MNEIDKLQLMADLTHEFCELNHGPDTRKENFQAVDYISVPFGYMENEITTVVAREINIPICKECADALCGDEWVLLVCKVCSSNHWVARKYSCHKYPPAPCIVWLDACPCCGKKGD